MKIKHLILAFGGASLLAACNLDEYPYGFYSEDNFYKTEADAESAVNYIYDAINYIEYSRSIVFLGDMNTDDMEPKGDAAAANKELDGWKINNFKTNTTLGNFYKYSYITINRANAVIKKVPGMNIDEGRRNRFLGEAYFMRAYSYFNLARNFGCVPVHTTPVETLEDTAVPAAEMDNYLVFTLGEILADGNTTGTCMNWAGEDAKNWDCVFAGASNPDTGKPVDLTQFYRQIPKGESTWLRNYSDGTITFTDADGNKTSCTLVPKGTYQMPNVPPIPLTLESEAFKFNLKGTEDWNNTYNDYGVFARNPVTYYIEIVKQPAGFEVPEASKTIEEPVDPEPEPEPDPEETSLAGTYSVGRLTVYGGSADPAFVNPVDKSWVWDDSIGKESDNILAMTATGTDDAGRETGECEYLPGEDGGYWNYILKADYNKEGTGALDLTKYYGLLPHGKSAYVYDAEAGTVVFTSGIVSITAKLLREGDYSYGSSTLSVPGIAFDFALPGQTTQGAYPWTDYDRFAVGPRNYVMLFNKQAEAGE